MPSIQILTKEDNKISIKLKGISLHHANALRRICLNGVPIFAIDTVDIIENSSVLPDEGITHTLGMIPLKTELDGLDESDSRVMLVLDSKAAENTTMVGVPAKAIRVGNKGNFRPYGVDQKVKDEQ